MLRTLAIRDRRRGEVGSRAKLYSVVSPGKRQFLTFLERNEHYGQRLYGTATLYRNYSDVVDSERRTELELSAKLWIAATT